MDDAVKYIHGLGGEGDVITTFQTLAETYRYPDPNTLPKLARIIAGSAGGGNKDAPLYELCHLINAVDAAGFHGQDALLTFFLTPKRVSPSHFKMVFQECSELNSWNRAGFMSNNTHVIIDYGDTEFTIHFGRIPLLTALFEFLSTMDNWTFFAELNDILKDMLGESVSNADIKGASNRMASRFRKYRHANIDWSKHEERFDKLSRFLSDQAENGEWSISDANIFTFWLLHSTGKEFRGYKTVFDAFVVLLKVIQKGQLTLSVQDAKVLGSNKDEGEIDPSTMDIPEGHFSEWENPLPIFDREELKTMKFLKGTSERQPIENLMKYGPYASKLPLAFLRLESFSPIQSAITNDLQMKRGSEQLQNRISCNDGIPYYQNMQTYANICDHLRSLQLAIWHIISQTEGANDHEESLIDDAKSAFDTLRRKGFETAQVDDEKLEAFVLAGETVVKMSQEIDRFRNQVTNSNLNISALYDEDKEIFSNQLHKIYGTSHE